MSFFVFGNDDKLLFKSLEWNRIISGIHTLRMCSVAGYILLLLIEDFLKPLGEAT
jgi:hypothetical protein